jgi:hypothetical protein
MMMMMMMMVVCDCLSKYKDRSNSKRIIESGMLASLYGLAGPRRPVLS